MYRYNYLHFEIITSFLLPLSMHMYRSNYLNAPDFDALETDSVASCESSAYSSKSESLSPTIGSVTELSDAGSYESFLEYDISRKPRTRRVSAVSHA